MLSINAKINIILPLKKKEWLKETNQLFYHLIKCICKIYVSALKTQSLRIPAFSFIEFSFIIISKQKFDHVSKLLSPAMNLSHLYGQSHLSLSRNIPSAKPCRQPASPHADIGPYHDASAPAGSHGSPAVKHRGAAPQPFIADRHIYLYNITYRPERRTASKRPKPCLAAGSLRSPAEGGTPAPTPPPEGANSIRGTAFSPPVGEIRGTSGHIFRRLLKILFYTIKPPGIPLAFSVVLRKL